MKKVYQVVWYTGEDDKFHSRDFYDVDDAVEFYDEIEDARNVHDVDMFEYYER